MPNVKKLIEKMKQQPMEYDRKKWKRFWELMDIFRQGRKEVTSII